jgi:hypothetical protein
MTTETEYEMLPEYDFSKARPNPYVHYDLREVTISIDSDLYNIFSQKADELGVSTERIINRALDDFAAKLPGKVGVHRAS